MGTLPLEEKRQVVLNGSGNGSVTIGPLNANQVWNPTSVSCAVDTNANEPVFVLYKGNGVGGSRIGGTYTGSNDSTDIGNVTLYPGQTLFGIWQGGDAGATATLTLFGTMEVP